MLECPFALPQLQLKVCCMTRVLHLCGQNWSSMHLPRSVEGVVLSHHDLVDHLTLTARSAAPRVKTSGNRTLVLHGVLLHDGMAKHEAHNNSSERNTVGCESKPTASGPVVPTFSFPRRRQNSRNADARLVGCISVETRETAQVAHAAVEATVFRRETTTDPVAPASTLRIAGKGVGYWVD